MPAKKETLVRVDGQQLALTNLDKVLYPATGTTKRDTISYLTAVADVMLPHLAGRPVTRKRWPDGVDGVEFFAKDLDMGTPGLVGTCPGGSFSQTKFYPVVDLRWLHWCGSRSQRRWSCTSRSGGSPRRGRLAMAGVPVVCTAAARSGIRTGWCSIWTLVPAPAFLSASRWPSWSRSAWAHWVS